MEPQMQLHGGHFGWFLGSCNFLCGIQGPFGWVIKTFDRGMGMNMILGKDYMILTILEKIHYCWGYIGLIGASGTADV